MPLPIEFEYDGNAVMLEQVDDGQGGVATYVTTPHIGFLITMVPPEHPFRIAVEEVMRTKESPNERH